MLYNANVSLRRQDYSFISTLAAVYDLRNGLIVRMNTTLECLIVIRMSSVVQLDSFHRLFLGLFVRDLNIRGLIPLIRRNAFQIGPNASRWLRLLWALHGPFSVYYLAILALDAVENRGSSSLPFRISFGTHRCSADIERIIKILLVLENDSASLVYGLLTRPGRPLAIPEATTVPEKLLSRGTSIESASAVTSDYSWGLAVTYIRYRVKSVYSLVIRLERRIIIGEVQGRMLENIDRHGRLTISLRRSGVGLCGLPRPTAGQLGTSGLTGEDVSFLIELLRYHLMVLEAYINLAMSLKELGLLGEVLTLEAGTHVESRLHVSFQLPSAMGVLRMTICGRDIFALICTEVSLGALW